MQYLLGAAPPELAEQMDELSITDDHFAIRLRAVENDLVDSYVRDELSGEDLQRFRAHFLVSQRRREKVEFAKSFTAVAERPKPPLPPRRSFFQAMQYAFAALILFLLLATGYLVRENAHLRGELEATRAEKARFEQQATESEKRAAGQSAIPEPKKILTPALTAALVLPPATRGAQALPVLSIAPGTDRAVFHLQLEANDFTRYRAALSDPATNRTVWRSGELTSKGEGRVVSVTVPTSLFRQQHYVLNLSGIQHQGATEFVGGYPFRVVLR